MIFFIIFLFSDIDECAIPELAAKCVENAECCNLPAEYVCKCKPGFEGDGQVECQGEIFSGESGLIGDLGGNRISHDLRPFLSSIRAVAMKG